MGRRVRTDVPLTDEHFITDWQFLNEFRRKDEGYKRKQKENYDEHHRVRSLDPLPNNSAVWNRKNNTLTPGIVTATANTPRSCMVSTPMGQLRRNHSHFLNRTVTSEDVTTVEQGYATLQSQSPVMTRSCAGVQLNPQRGLLTKKERVV